jgi:hypothetical protein
MNAPEALRRALELCDSMLADVPKVETPYGAAYEGVHAATVETIHRIKHGIRASAALADAPAAPPDTSQEWAKLDGATAFLLIDRHAEDWADTGRMMDAWRTARAPTASWAFVLAAIVKESDRSWHAAQMFPQVMDESRATRRAIGEALSALRWAAKSGMPLPTDAEVSAQAALIDADKVRG